MTFEDVMNAFSAADKFLSHENIARNAAIEAAEQRWDTARNTHREVIEDLGADLAGQPEVVKQLSAYVGGTGRNNLKARLALTSYVAAVIPYCDASECQWFQSEVVVVTPTVRLPGDADVTGLADSVLQYYREVGVGEGRGQLCLVEGSPLARWTGGWKISFDLDGGNAVLTHSVNTKAKGTLVECLVDAVFHCPTYTKETKS